MLRRGWLACLVVGLCSAFPSGPAQGSEPASASRLKAARGAVKLVTPRGKPLPGRWQSWADASLVPTVSGRVIVHLARCPARPASAGCIYTRRPRTVYIRPGLKSPRGVLLHELGHVYDLKVMNNRDRGGFRRLIGRSAKRKWWVGRRPLAEQFAEAYSWCARYARIVSITRYSSYAYRPTARQHHRICRLIKRAAVDRRPSAPPPEPPVVTGPEPPPPPPPSTAPGVVPGDPERDPGPQPPEDPDAPLPLPVPLPPVPTPVPPIYDLPPPPGGAGGGA